MTYNSIEAERRTLSSHISATELTPAAARPVYCFEDYEFLIAISTTDVVVGDEDALVAANVVTIPMPYSDGSTIDTCTAGTTWASPVNLPMDTKFKAAVTYYVTSSCFQTLRLAEIAGFFRQNMFAELMPYLMPRFKASDLPEVTRI